MKNIILPAFIGMAALLAPLPTQAAMVASNGTQAQKLVEEDGYIIFAYADGWDEYSKSRCEALIKNDAIRKAAGDAVLMPLPIPEQPDEKRRKKQDELRGGLNVPGCMSYPALIMLDSKGQYYASIEGGPVARGKASDLAELIAKRMAAGKKRARLIAESEDASLDGPARARKLFAAYQLEGLSWAGKGFAERLRKLDPKDEAGTVRATNFNGHGFAGKVSGMGVAEGMAEVDKMLKDPAYTPRQKQLMCAAVLGMLRRKGGMGEADAMRRYAKLMQELVPGTPEAGAAAKILRDWIPGFYYPRGWSPACLPADGSPMELMGEIPIKEPGTYIMSFHYSSGRMALVIEAVELYDGKVKIAEDRHRGTAGNNNWKNEYSLTVPKTVKNPRIFVTINNLDRDSSGRVNIRKEK